MAIPSEAPRFDNALQFMDYYLDPEVAAAQTTAVKIDTGNASARDLLSAEVLANPVIFPPEDVLAILHFTADLGGDESLYDDAWSKVKDS
jgi:spermidine/putrescine transport system substrate-binding protein